MENYLEKYDFNTRVLSLSNEGLTTMCHLELLSVVEKMDLSNNHLIDVKNFSCMRCIKELNLDGNQISDVAELSFLPNLELLSIRRNCILCVEIYSFRGMDIPPKGGNSFKLVFCFLLKWLLL